MPRDSESQSPLIRRTAWSALGLLVGWLLFKALDLGGGAAWRALRVAGGWSLAVTGLILAVLMLSVALGVAAGRIRLPVTRARIWGSWLIRYAPYALRDLAAGRKVSRGTGNRRWTAEEEFEREGPRRVGDRDQLHSDFGHWHDPHISGGIRVSFIHATGELVAVALGTEDCPIELLGYASDSYHAEQLLEDWAYAHSLRWARYRCRGWKIPLEPAPSGGRTSTGALHALGPILLHLVWDELSVPITAILKTSTTPLRSSTTPGLGRCITQWTAHPPASRGVTQGRGQPTCPEACCWIASGMCRSQRLSTHFEKTLSRIWPRTSS